MRSKTLLFLLLAGFWLQAAAGVDGEKYCRLAIEENTERAQWGLDLRARVMAKCKGNFKSACAKPFVDAIYKQNVRDKQVLIDLFNSEPTPEHVRILMQGMVTWKLVAAERGLIGMGSSGQEIASQIYSDCLSGIPAARAAGNAAIGSIPSVTPACTNYTLMGPDGRAQYCQNCCYSGNCQVYCN